MLREGGYAVLTGPDGVVERSTFTCGHCQKIVHVKPRERPEDVGGLCKVCMHLICPSCVDRGCTPFEKRIEAMEARDVALRSYGIG